MQRLNRHHHRGGSRGALPPSSHVSFPTDPNHHIPNPNFVDLSFSSVNPYLQNINSYLCYNPYMQSASFYQQQALQNGVKSHGSPKEQENILERIEGVVKKAHTSLLASGESISAWKVSQSSLLNLQIDSWASLGFQLHDIPSLFRLIGTEAKVNTFIHCFVGVRKITSLYDLEVEICKNESIDRFEELGLGPLLKHPLVKHYFSIPSSVEDVFKITGEDVVSFLVEFMDNYGYKEVKAESLVEFIAKKRSVPAKENLGVRIQSLGYHITCIKKAKKEELATLKRFLHTFKQTTGEEARKVRKEFAPHPCTTSEKKTLDRRFKDMSRRMRSFSSLEESFKGKHIRFISSSSEDGSENDKGEENSSEDDTDPPVNDSHQNGKCKDQHSSSCPYPSATEEMLRLGLKAKIDEETYPSVGSCKKKRKWDNHNLSSSNLNKISRENKSPPTDPHMSESVDKIKINKKSMVLQGKKQDVLSSDDITYSWSDNPTNSSGLFLNYNKIENFVSMWTEACREHSVSEVLDRMLNFYNVTRIRRRKKTRTILSSFPAIGLLNVAVFSIKYGMWDSHCDSLGAIEEDRMTTEMSVLPTELTDDAFATKINAVPGTKELFSEVSGCVSVDEIIKNLISYLELDILETGDKNLQSENPFMTLRKLHECELWLVKHFSEKDFCSLGHGDFLVFLEKHASMLPLKIKRYLTGCQSENSHLEASILKRQLQVLLSQSISNDLSRGAVGKKEISVLLKNQFPSVCFRITGIEPRDDFLNHIKSPKGCDSSKSVFFSAALLESHHLRDSSQIIQQPCGMSTRVDSFGSVTEKDALDCLIKAPMLLDLHLWSHWDQIYAPSLGTLIDFLLNMNQVKELSCMVTRSGKLIRLDHSATLDKFLDAAVHGFSFHTAVQLLSLLCLYGGINHAPVSLLKCHAQRAMEVMVQNSMDCTESNNHQDFMMNVKSLIERGNTDVYSNDIFFPIVGKEREQQSNLNVRNNLTTSAPRFILDCLSCLPSECWCFAADIFLSGLQSVIKESPIAILYECTNNNQRIMLHELGLSLGILEWVEDYRTLKSVSFVDALNSPISQTKSYKVLEQSDIINPKNTQLIPNKLVRLDEPCKSFDETHPTDTSDTCRQRSEEIQEASHIIEAIRCEEFGLDSNLKHDGSNLLKKQHARLGRALQCLSQELYSQDSHFLLELIQNADDNFYPENAKPTLVFVLQDTRIVVLNNEQGFSAQNIRALCDVGNSTKKGSKAGYIGQKGIGFKSVFRVTDAPEIHSNGFHVKFDITEGQIGFVLPTVVPPFNFDSLTKDLCDESSELVPIVWNTCVVLPFKTDLKEEFGRNSVVSMFSDLHPSLLLFLHRLECIKFKNTITDSLVIMRRETIGDGIIKVSHGNENMTWWVCRKKLHPNSIRHDVETTEIAIAFTLDRSDNGDSKPCLNLQPVFAFLPLRTYGLKFILQADFVLPSSREEVDGNCAWNQWLLSEFPSLFVSAEKSFCSLNYFCTNLGKAVTAYMNFVPLIGEVYGFFSRLPHLIISKLRQTDCLINENGGWVFPCKLLRGWDEQGRLLMPENLLIQYLGLEYLNRDILLSNTLANALGVHEYGPKLLVDFISSLCCTANGISSMGMDWLSSWLNTLYSMMVHYGGETNVRSSDTECDIINNLRKIPFIPLADGSYSSLSEGPIWLPSDSKTFGSESGFLPEDFPTLYSKLRTINPMFLSTSTSTNRYNLGETGVANLRFMLLRIGVQSLSGHEIMKCHILLSIFDEKKDKNLLAEYLSFVMLHLQSNCITCDVERTNIYSQLQQNVVLLTNHGYVCPIEKSIHFSSAFGNPYDINKLITGTTMEWVEIDNNYLKYPNSYSLSNRVMKWRKFFEELGITDFVQVTAVDRNAIEVYKDWESPELEQLLSILSSKKSREKCGYLLEVLDEMWDAFGSKVSIEIVSKCGQNTQILESSFIKCLRESKWVSSSVDAELHSPKDLFFSCDAVRSLLGSSAPYAVPEIKNKRFLKEIGFKTQVTFEDALRILQIWRSSKTSFKASIVQMCNFYTFLWDGIKTGKRESKEEIRADLCIFVPSLNSLRHDGVLHGTFFPPEDVYWNDPTGCSDEANELFFQSLINDSNDCYPKTLSSIYPTLHHFFVKACDVFETPPFHYYFSLLLQLSRVSMPSQAIHIVIRLFLKWANDLKSGLMGSEEISFLKESLLKLENPILPTLIDKWVSLHPSFGLVCWCDNEDLQNQFNHSKNVVFVNLGLLNMEEKSLVSALLQAIGISPISKVVDREAIYYGVEDNYEKVSMLDWILPYAQRYLHHLHKGVYYQMQDVWSESLIGLKIVVVQKLFYKYTLKGCDGASKKRFSCSCLLQGSMLYITQAADSHSIFLELSRLFFKGSTELQMANFLLMITTMVESGSDEEQVEFFIVNSQKIPKLPDKESLWSYKFLSALCSDKTRTTATLSNTELSLTKYKVKTDIHSKWPPTNWKGAPDVTFPREKNYGVLLSMAPEIVSNDSIDFQNCPKLFPSTNWVVNDESLTELSSMIQVSDRHLGSQENHSINCLKTSEESSTFASNRNSDSVPSFTGTDQLYFGKLNERQNQETGRLGEFIAYKYFVEKLGSTAVKWVNEEIETGLPYDLIIGKDEESREYVEVKATKSIKKDWFMISPREWQFACERGESFTIVHVTLSDLKNTKITVFQNPAKLCQTDVLQLAVLILQP